MQPEDASRPSISDAAAQEVAPPRDGAADVSSDVSLDAGPDAGPDAGLDAADAGPLRRVFFTSTTYAATPGARGGGPGARGGDFVCAQVAAGARLSGTFRAWSTRRSPPRSASRRPAPTTTSRARAPPHGQPASQPLEASIPDYWCWALAISAGRCEPGTSSSTAAVDTSVAASWAPWAGWISRGFWTSSARTSAPTRATSTASSSEPPSPLGGSRVRSGSARAHSLSHFLRSGRTVRAPRARRGWPSSRGARPCRCASRSAARGAARPWSSRPSSRS